MVTSKGPDRKISFRLAYARRVPDATRQPHGVGPSAFYRIRNGLTEFEGHFRSFRNFQMQLHLSQVMLDSLYYVTSLACETFNFRIDALVNRKNIRLTGKEQQPQIIYKIQKAHDINEPRNVALFHEASRSINFNRLADRY